MRLSRQTQSATVRTWMRRPVGTPKAPSPRCVIVETMRCELRKPPSSSPETMMSSASRRRSGNIASVAAVPSMTCCAVVVTPVGVSTMHGSA